MKNKKKKGFTLTEVLVVVLVIGVISAIAYPTYTKAINKSRAVEAINLLEMVRNKQIAYFARNGEYISDFTKMGQLTGDQKNETVGSPTSKLLVGKYELDINTEAACMTASYIPAKGKPASFTFSSGYEEAGLGCDGSICSSFGNIVGGTDSVCNCGSKDCGPGFDMNPLSCECTCPLECNQNGSCTNKTLTKALEQPCQNNGKQTRTCSPSCDGGDCSAWGPCTGQTCGGAQPSGMRDCGNKCGKESGAVSCNGTTGSWEVKWSGVCSGEGECVSGTSEPCGNNNTGTRTCSSTCGWGQCTGAKTSCPATCGEGEERNPAVSYVEDGNCCEKVNKKTPCGECTGGKERNWEVEYEEDGQCCTCFSGNVMSLCRRSGGYQNQETCECVCPSNAHFETGNFPGAVDGMGGCRCDDGYEGTPSSGQTCVKKAQWTYKTEVLSSVVSGCSGAGSGNVTVCYGGVAYRELYTAHQLTRCEHRAGGNKYGYVADGDGSPCNDTNWIDTYGKEPREAYCTGGSGTLPNCTSYNFDEQCASRGYESYLCIMTNYGTGCTQVASYPCLQDGTQCRYLGGGSADARRIATASNVSVVKCVRK